MDILSTINKKHIVFFLLAFILFFTRIISFREFSLDPDELEYLHSIRRCMDNPLPFYGFDNHTTGPFAIYLFVLIKLLIGFSKLYQLRLISFFFFILPSVFFVYQICQKSAKLIGILTLIVLLCAKNFPFFGNYYDGIYCYNTEYQILLFTSLLFWILRLKEGLGYYLVYSFVLFLLPYIKFQSIPLVLFFGGYLILLLLKKNKWKWILISCSFYLILNIVWVLFLYFKGIYPAFHYAYISKNLNYMSNSNFGEKGINPLNFFNRINGYYSFIYIFLGIFFYQLTQRFKVFFTANLLEVLLHPLSQSFLLLLVSCATIIVSKNDFGHYYIYLFLPLSIFIADVYHFCFPDGSSNDMKKTVYPIFLIILICNFNFEYFGKSLGFVWNKLKHQEFNQYNFGKPLNSLADTNLISWLTKNKGKNESLLVLGWTESQAIYYVLQNDFRLQSRSSHSFYIQDSFRTKNSVYFEKEEQIFLEDMQKEKPQFIVDTWNLLPEIKGTKIPQFVAQNYQLKLSTDKYQIYERNDLKK